MTNILGFTTYPVKYPLHGGQRRITAFMDFFGRLGVSYETVCIYEGQSYSRDKVGPYDIPLKYIDIEISRVPFIGDLLSGLYGADDSRAIEHFSNVVRQKKPCAIFLDQPFMWPLVEKMRSQDPAIAAIPMIYSSQNWEAPLKYEMLVRSGVNRSVALKIKNDIEILEQAVVRASHLVFACSKADAQIYKDLDPGKRIIVVKNGVNRPHDDGHFQADPTTHFAGSKYLFFVGSAYPPNIDGLCSLLLEKGLFFMPPRRGFAICGGAADGIFKDERYQKFLGSNSERVQFYKDISDNDLARLKSDSHAIILPINFGGGSNLKTAEALASGKWIVATPTAMRGYEDFLDAPGVILADGPSDFRKAVIKVLSSDPLELSDTNKNYRETVYWDRRFDGLTFEDLGL